MKLLVFSWKVCKKNMCIYSVFDPFEYQNIKFRNHAFGNKVTYKILINGPFGEKNNLL